MTRLPFALICLLGISLGCGQGGVVPPPGDTAVESETALPTDQLKATLEEIAKTGEAGSSAAGLRPALEAMKGKDAAKGAALLKDLSQLESSTNPAQVKSIAKKMAGQL